MIQIINGEIKQYQLPHVGRLSDGSMVSGYHLLPPTVLSAEGWLPLKEEDIPEYNHETEYIQPKYTIQVNHVIKGFDVKKIPTDPVRLALQKLIKLTDLTSEEIEIMVDIYDPYEVGKNYIPGTVFKYLGKLYRVIQEHTSQEDWIPSEVPALYTKVIPDGVIEQWGDRDLTVNPFMIGDKVIFEGGVYKSIIDNNAWSPSAYKAGWTRV